MNEHTRSSSFAILIEASNFYMLAVQLLGVLPGPPSVEPQQLRSAASPPKGYRLIADRLDGDLSILASASTDPEARPEDWKVWHEKGHWASNMQHILATCFCMLTSYAVLCSVEPTSPLSQQLVGVKPALPRAVCEKLLREVSSQEFEWATQRHALYPTTDVPVHALPWLEREMDGALRTSILPGFATLFGIDKSQLLMRDMFVVKYSSDAQRELATHWDESCFSFVIQVRPCPARCDATSAGQHD